MPDIFSTDVPFICNSMQKILDDSNGFKSEDMRLSINQLSEYVEIQKYKYNNGRTFGVLASRFYNRSNILDFYAMFDEKWYNNATSKEKQLIFDMNLNVKNRELDAPIYLNVSTFNGEIGEEEYEIIIMGYLKVNYDNCVMIGNEERYQTNYPNTFENCVFTMK